MANDSAIQARAAANAAIKAAKAIKSAKAAEKAKANTSRPTRRPQRPGSVKHRSGWGKATDFHMAQQARAARAGR